MDGFGLDAHHFRDAGPADVGVHDADRVGRVGSEGVGEHGGEGGFADAAFAAEDEEFVFDAGEAGGDERDVGVGAFGGGGTDDLVGAAGAGGALAGEGGFGAGAVFWVVVRVDTDLDGEKGGGGGDRIPGSGATSLGAILRGALMSTWMGSSREGAMVGKGSQTMPVFLEPYLNDGLLE